MRKHPLLKSKIISLTGLGILSVLVVVGSVRAYLRGGNDFLVFYEAWRLVLSGNGSEIYRISPDRFLYSPGFAWLLSPLGIFSREVSLAVWCFFKALVIGLLVKRLSNPKAVGGDSLLALGMSAWGAILVSRPLLIDFEYGQVNLFILGACIWGLSEHFRKGTTRSLEILSWGVLTFAAIAKLFPLPLLLVPWTATRGVSQQKLRNERIAILIGFLIAFLLPCVSLGWLGAWQLVLGWKDAILARGLPLESHNQSFPALLYHYLSGNPTSVISEGSQPLFLGHQWLSSSQIILLSLAWTIASLGVVLGWIVSSNNHSHLKWIAVAVGLLIVPSHLIWKPYFVMSMPLAILIVQEKMKYPTWKVWVFMILLFSGINLTGFDFVGHNWGAHFEAASVLLLLHLTLIGLVVCQPDTANP